MTTRTSMKDYLGRDVVVGDYIFYSTTGRYAESRVCKVARFTPKTLFATLVKGNRGGSWTTNYNKDFAVQNSFVKMDAAEVEAWIERAG